jgi:membrane fusion protein
LPHDLELVAEAYVPSRAIGFIQSGQAVRLMYDAFPQQKFGAFAGQIEHVSDFVLLPSDIPQTFPLREATYKIVIAIDYQAVDIGAIRTPLRPGMLLAAEIVLERRSFVDWLLEPLKQRRKAVG